MAARQSPLRNGRLARPSRSVAKVFARSNSRLMDTLSEEDFDGWDKDNGPPTPLLDTINYPMHLKNLNTQQLESLAKEIRAELIHVVSKTGGHLGSSLGVVELTIAMHYVFNCPEDRFVFDVGHQAYPHKILTGRRERLKTIRQTGGLSGPAPHVLLPSLGPWQGPSGPTPRALRVWTPSSPRGLFPLQPLLATTSRRLVRSSLSVCPRMCCLPPPPLRVAPLLVPLRRLTGRPSSGSPRVHKARRERVRCLWGGSQLDLHLCRPWNGMWISHEGFRAPQTPHQLTQPATLTRFGT